jgi:hypothetical protein
VSLSSYLFFCDFNVTNADHSLFSKIDKYSITSVLVYVDDVIVIENNKEEIRNIKPQLKEKLTLKFRNIKIFLRH